MGAKVPCSECKLSLIDRVFTRLGARDNIMQGKSTFMIEMEETSLMLRQVMRASLSDLLL